MSVEAVTPETERKRAVSPGIKRVLSFVVGVLLWSVILFVAAGRMDWVRGRIYVGLYVGCLAATEVIVAMKRPGLLSHRAERHGTTQKFDKIILPVLTVTFLVMPAVAGLDAVRFGWSHAGWNTLIVAVPLFLLGCVPIPWSMVVNPYHERTVRVQEDRGHEVVKSGPYAMVRHPMYAGVILQSLAAPLILGSFWSYIPIAMTILTIVIRTSFEDRMLRKELPGYQDYTKTTQFRLVPGLW